MKPEEFFDSAGMRIPLGAKLGCGGEGAVYAVPAISDDIVAKVYQAPLAGDKPEKLKGMVKGCDSQLKKIAAWPTATLHLGRSGPVCGFLMPKLIGYEPIHKLYSPAHRKQLFPNADWAFLVHTARNIAAAFKVIHDHGHVIGDVNQGNIFVAKDSTVKLIDCDSFQFDAVGKSYICEVGVPHFTPPELQTVSSFSRVRRTANHDNFGLAVLCFHLLFMGRHPFAGVFAGKEDMPIEKAIQEFRFAFGKDAPSKQMSPPPNSPLLPMVPPQVEEFFERAFSEAGSQQSIGRRVAHAWVQSLEQLERSLRPCPSEQIHKYSPHLSGCPWCGLERLSGVLFFIEPMSSASGMGAFHLAAVWQNILSVSSPGPAPSITPEQFKDRISPKPIPPDIRDAKITKTVLAVIIVVVAVVLTFSLHWASLVVGLIAANYVFFSPVNDSLERRHRKSKLADAQDDWHEIERKWEKEAGASMFDAERHNLERFKRQHESLDRDYAEEKHKARAKIRERQLHKFLDGFFIESHKIPQIGASRTATLASFGIETAADIDDVKIQKIPGFGKVYTRNLVDWRKELERKFVFDPSKGIDPADLAAMDQRFRQRRKETENVLLGGAQRLTHFAREAIQRRKTLQDEVKSLARRLAQARADLSVFG